MTVECPKCGYDDGLTVSTGYIDADTHFREWICPVCRTQVDYQESRLDPLSGRREP